MKDDGLITQLESLGLNPLMYGVDRDELTDTPAERVRAYERQIEQTAEAIERVVRGKA